jgi:hypothetical protein
MSATVEPSTPAKPKHKPAKTNAYPFWSPRLWHGMRFRDWWRLLARNHFRIHPLRWVMAAIITKITLIDSALYRLQQLRHGRKIDETPIEPPVFIVGHWRSGTTHLHELLVQDDRFAFPSTYECFAPWHFVVSEWIVPRFMGMLLPGKRPMDNMAVGFDRPQEDEFALCAMGAPTPYAGMAFPNNPQPYLEFLEMEGCDEKDLARFKKSLTWFMRSLTYYKKKRLVLKSPPHTGRIGVLSEMFPGARFVHIVRDPLTMFPSTRRLWPALIAPQALQHSKFPNLDEYVFDCFERMYRGFNKQRPSIDPDHLCEIRYEDLVRDPLGEVRAIYKKLNLGDFEYVRPKLEAYVSGQKDYQANRHDLEPQIVSEIQRRWGWYMERYGY